MSLLPEKHRKYALYIARHKYYVYREGRKLGVPIWLLIAHDWTKLLPDEWQPYVEYFNGGPHRPWSAVSAYEKTYHWDAAWKGCKEGVQEAFDAAWNRHQKRNPHHWQYWLLRRDDGTSQALPMPYDFVLEMIADWKGAGLANGKPDTRAWYLKNRQQIHLHTVTRAQVECILAVDPLDYTWH